MRCAAKNQRSKNYPRAEAGQVSRVPQACLKEANESRILPQLQWDMLSSIPARAHVEPAGVAPHRMQAQPLLRRAGSLSRPHPAAAAVAAAAVAPAAAWLPVVPRMRADLHLLPMIFMINPFEILIRHANVSISKTTRFADVPGDTCSKRFSDCWYLYQACGARSRRTALSHSAARWNLLATRRRGRVVSTGEAGCPGLPAGRS
eukprot:2601016-Pleurochrysis_carterae.AAC.4